MDERRDSLRQILTDHSCGKGWRNVLSCHTTNRKDSLIRNLDDCLSWVSGKGGGFEACLSLPSSFDHGDAQSFQVRSSPHSKKKEAENEVCLLALVDLLLRCPDKVVMKPVSFRGGESSIKEIREAARSAQAAIETIQPCPEGVRCQASSGSPSLSSEFESQPPAAKRLHISSALSLANMGLKVLGKGDGVCASGASSSSDALLRNTCMRSSTYFQDAVDHGSIAGQRHFVQEIGGVVSHPSALSSSGFYSKRASPKRHRTPRCAFVCVLWPPAGDAVEQLIANALTLGFQLRSSRHARVILATSGLVREAAADALRLYWDVREIRHIRVAEFMLSRCDQRFRHVFTKLSVMRLEEFSKVVLLDADLLPRGNVDELFDFPAPAAIFRGYHDHTPGMVRPCDTFYFEGSLQGSSSRQACRCSASMQCVHRELKGGINAGVVILRPSSSELELMQHTLLDEGHGHRCHVASTGPEQDFLTRWYDEHWRSFPRKFNWQLQQSMYTRSKHETESDRFRLDYNDLRILHFSTEDKPSAQLFGEGQQDIHQRLRAFESKHGKLPSEDVGRWLWCAIVEWHEAFMNTWRASLEKVVVHPAQTAGQSCLFCPAQHPLSVEHCFLRCPHVVGFAEVWKSECGLPHVDLDALRTAPRGLAVAPSLRFLGRVHRLWSLAGSKKDGYELL